MFFTVNSVVEGKQSKQTHSSQKRKFIVFLWRIGLIQVANAKQNGDGSMHSVCFKYRLGIHVQKINEQEHSEMNSTVRVLIHDPFSEVVDAFRVLFYHYRAFPPIYHTDKPFRPQIGVNLHEFGLVLRQTVPHKHRLSSAFTHTQSPKE